MGQETLLFRPCPDDQGPVPAGRSANAAVEFSEEKEEQ
jgi:hypothetical protein